MKQSRLSARSRVQGARYGKTAVLRASEKYKDVRDLVYQRIKNLKLELESSPHLATWGTGKPNEALEDYRISVIRSYKAGQRDGPKAKMPFESLRKAYIDGGPPALDVQLKTNLYGRILASKFTDADIMNQSQLADLRYPAEWFPSTRQLRRIVHLHVGPTNSGKTYHALKKLEEANSGVYAGPLRLLAHEVYTKLNAKGKQCNLVTGDDRRIAENGKAEMYSCTVEMVPVNTPMDVAVIDEIQMLGSIERGWAWTQALLGVKAKEVHLCGEVRVVPLIRELVASTGDKLEIHYYERLSPLKTMTSSLGGDLKKLRKGDCVVVFSRLGIHAMKKEIEKATGKRVAVVYGSLPPETRAQQAKLFNDPDNDYDILVASDAIGMGLNLSIKRIIFESSQKMDEKGYGTLAVSQIKQIAGRAGRYRTTEQRDAEVGSDKMTKGVTDPAKNVLAPLPPAKNLGLVTTLEHSDLPIIQQAMESEAAPLRTAGIFPPPAIIQRFASYFPPQTPFSYVLLRLYELTRWNPRFHLCQQKEQMHIADLIQPMKLTIADRITFCAAPAPLRKPGFPDIVKKFAQCVADQAGGDLLGIEEFNLVILDDDRTPDKERLEQLEILHKSLVLYLWLSYRFAGVFKSRPLATHVKELVEEKIEQGLAHAALDRSRRDRMREKRERSLIHTLKKDGLVRGDGEGLALPLTWEAPRHGHIQLPDAQASTNEATLSTG
ncbi:MAG: RNA helicase [Candelina submexicana]|nr:MAG: RNA helicase [Candelina submexicana]